MIDLIDDNSFYVSVDTRSFFAKAKKTEKIFMRSAVRSRTYITNKPWQPWGDDNLWPYKLQNLLNLVPEAQVCLDVLSSYTYGNGLGVYETSESEGKQVKKPVYDEKQQAW